MKNSLCEHSSCSDKKTRCNVNKMAYQPCGAQLEDECNKINGYYCPITNNGNNIMF